MPATRKQQQRSLTGLYIVLALASVVAGLVFDKPGFALAWLWLVIAAFSHPSPAPAKRGDSESPGAIAKEMQHRLHIKLGEGLFGAGLFPGLRIRYGWFFHLGIGAVVFHLPITDVVTDYADVPFDGWGQIANAAAATLIVSAFPYTLRTFATRRYMNSTEDLGKIDPFPMTSVADAIRVARSSPPVIIGPAVIGVIAGLVAAPWLVEHHTDWPGPAVAASTMLLGVLVATYPAARVQAVRHWRRLTEARQRWDQGFAQIKMVPAPRLVDVEHLNSGDQVIIIHHFRSSPGLGGFEKIANQSGKILATLGGSAQAALAPVEQRDSQKQPIAGTVDNLAFDVIELPDADQMPQLSHPGLDDEVVEQVLRAIFAQVSSAQSKRVMPLDHQRVSAADSEQAVYTVGYSPAGYDPTALSSTITGVASGFGAEALVDTAGGEPQVIVGGLAAAEFDDHSGITVEHLQHLERAEWWKKKWTDAFKKDNQSPRPEWDTESSAALADGTVIHSLSFVLLNGQSPEENYFPIEHRVASALDGIPFFSMTGHHRPDRRAGTRHQVAVACRWSESPVPSDPSEITPARPAKAQQWALAAAVNEAFVAVKLPRPELVEAKPLSRGEGPALWHLYLRLYGGVTLKQVRDKARAMRETLATDFLRIAESSQGVELVIGADPAEANLNVQAHRLLDSLDWEQAFIDAKMDGLGGSMPRLVSTTPGEHNKAITTLRFDLAGTGFNLESFASRRNKLMATSGKAFLMPVPVADDPTALDLIVSDRDPFPSAIEPDYRMLDGTDDTQGVPFASDIYANPVFYAPSESPHMLYVGLSGSGKSVTLQQLIYGFLVQGAEVFAADPSKHGADFEFGRDFMSGLTGELFEAAGMMRYIYAETTRRKKLNAEYGVGNITELPDDVRPRRIVLVVDEFTSLITQEKLPAKAPTNPEAAKTHELNVAANEARALIADRLGRIGREARSSAITLILAGQKVTASMLDGIGGASDLKTNMARAIQGKSNYAERATAMRNPQGAPDLGDEVPVGRGIYEPTVGSPAAYQSWFEPGGQRRLSEMLAERLEPVDPVNLSNHVHRPSEEPAVQRIGGDEHEEEPIAVELDSGDLSDIDWDADDGEDCDDQGADDDDSASEGPREDAIPAEGSEQADRASEVDPASEPAGELRDEITVVSLDADNVDETDDEDHPEPEADSEDAGHL